MIRHIIYQMLKFTKSCLPSEMWDFALGVESELDCFFWKIINIFYSIEGLIL